MSEVRGRGTEADLQCDRGYLKLTGLTYDKTIDAVLSIVWGRLGLLGLLLIGLLGLDNRFGRTQQLDQLIARFGA